MEIIVSIAAPSNANKSCIAQEITSHLAGKGLHAVILTEQPATSKEDAMAALLARCNPPGYTIEPAPRSHEYIWAWDACDDESDSYGAADSEEDARADAWAFFHRAEAERAVGDR